MRIYEVNHSEGLTSIAMCVDFWEVSTTKHSSALDLEGLVISRWLNRGYQ